MRSRVNSFKEFIEEMNEDSFQIMHSMKCNLSDFLKEKLVRFKADVGQEDLDKICEFFEKSFMTGDSLIGGLKTRRLENDVQFYFSSNRQSLSTAKQEFCDMLSKTLVDICRNMDAVCEKDKEKTKKFIDKFYNEQEV